MEAHILNGDALYERFPQDIPGMRIIARECLVDGTVSGETFEEFVASRIGFLTTTYGLDPAEYQTLTLPEWEKIRQLPEQTEVYLWFEEDLFCQVNLWFLLDFLQQHQPHLPVSLVLPDAGNRYGFGGMDESALVQAWKNSLALTPDVRRAWARLWQHYRDGELEEMLAIGQEYEGDMPFLLSAIQAHVDRIEKDGVPGRPDRTLRSIMEEMGTASFGPVFREFCRRESMYGYGDLQVKRMFDELKTHM